MSRMRQLDARRIAGYRLAAGGLAQRSAPGNASLRQAAHAGLQDSWPRAALLSVHARVEQAEADAGTDPTLTQVWGPRFNVYVVNEDDSAVFTLGRQPPSGSRRELGIALADRLEVVLGGDAIAYRDAGRALGIHPNQLRYAALTGRVRVRWEGTDAPFVWTVPSPEVDPAEVRRELARRFLHTLGPSTAVGFARWAGVKPRQATITFDELAPTLTEVATPIGDAVVLADDLDSFEQVGDATGSGVRLLPSGDNHVLRWDRERELQVADETRRADLWTTRVWPGALLVDGELAGTWRRSNTKMTVTPWRGLDDDTRAAVEAEARTLPLPGVELDVIVSWNPPLLDQ